MVQARDDVGLDAQGCGRLAQAIRVILAPAVHERWDLQAPKCAGVDGPRGSRDPAPKDDGPLGARVVHRPPKGLILGRPT